MFAEYSFPAPPAGLLHMCQGLNSHYFHIIGDKLINPIVGVYISIVTIPTKGEMTIPNIVSLDPGTYSLGLGIVTLTLHCSAGPLGVGPYHLHKFVE